jgi:hypothetical protein
VLAHCLLMPGEDSLEMTKPDFVLNRLEVSTPLAAGEATGAGLPRFLKL